MPLEEITGGLLRILFRLVFEIVFEGFCYYTGEILIRVFTLGRRKSNPPQSRKQSKSRRSSGHEKDPNLAIMVGLIFWVLMIVIIL